MDVGLDKGILHTTSFLAEHIINIRNLKINIDWKGVTSGVYKDSLHHLCNIQGLELLEMSIEHYPDEDYPTKDKIDINMVNSFNLSCSEMVKNPRQCRTIRSSPSYHPEMVIWTMRSDEASESESDVLLEQTDSDEQQSSSEVEEDQDLDALSEGDETEAIIMCRRLTINVASLIKFQHFVDTLTQYRCVRTSIKPTSLLTSPNTHGTTLERDSRDKTDFGGHFVNSLNGISPA